MNQRQSTRDRADVGVCRALADHGARCQCPLRKHVHDLRRVRPVAAAQANY